MLAAFNVADASDIELDELVALVAEMAVITIFFWKTYGRRTVSYVIPCADFEYRHKNHEF